MSKYINADAYKKLIEEEKAESYPSKDKFEDGCKIGLGIAIEILDEMPSADVVEVEMLKKNIEANLDEAKKLRDEHSSELIRAFQQGRMFGHECDLEMIKRKETE